MLELNYGSAEEKKKLQETVTKKNKRCKIANVYFLGVIQGTMLFMI